LTSVVPENVLRLDHQLVSLEQRADGSVRLDFASGVKADADAVVGADGVHSVVRDTLFGGDTPAFTGRVAYRTVFPATLLDGYQIDDCTKWWGPDRHIVIYYVKPDRSEVYFVTLLGDACHPMTPYMAQGAAMAFEDAAVLSRCLDGVDRSGVADAFRRFESTRKPRTSQVQLGSRTNTWLRNQTNPDWVYGYDAWTAPLVD
jgi:2-polyprenyl-6-methoxyphenol hydroxylase-like FAD-dependent oxidoreductase